MVTAWPDAAAHVRSGIEAHEEWRTGFLQSLAPADSVGDFLGSSQLSSWWDVLRDIRRVCDLGTHLLLGR